MNLISTSLRRCRRPMRHAVLAAALLGATPWLLPPSVSPTWAAETCEPAWQAGTIYTGSEIISHQQQRYQAKWWTKGDDPTQSGPYGPWRLLGACASVTPAPVVTPPPTEVPTPTPTPVVTPTPTPSPTPVVTPTPTPVVTPTPTAVPGALPAHQPTVSTYYDYDALGRLQRTM
ncbi:carbohydrate-binding protein, partial [Chitiniphilus eburneus]